MIIMIITGDPCGCGQVPTDPQQQGDPHHLGGRDFKSAAVKVPFLTIIKKPALFLHFVDFRGVSRADGGMYVCFVTNPRGGFNYRPAYLTVVPSKAFTKKNFSFFFFMTCSLMQISRNRITCERVSSSLNPCHLLVGENQPHLSSLNIKPRSSHFK